SPSLTAVNGSKLATTGYVTLTFHRDDERVRFGRVTWKFLVVASLRPLDCELLLGTDVISGALHGIHIVYDSVGSLQTVEAACSSRLTSTPIASVAAVAVPPDPSGCIPAPYSRRLSRHVDVKEGTGRRSGAVRLSASDFDVDFDPSRGYWSFQWKWKGGVPPSGRIGSNVGEYTKTLTTDERKAYQAELQSWKEQGWLVRYDPKVHGPIGCMLPLMGVPQPHKPSSPLRPVADCRVLNRHLENSPGDVISSCPDVLRSWRMAGPA
ncbi:hypothetical protein FOZ62_032195, partial [Perkinsus olseni]